MSYLILALEDNPVHARLLDKMLKRIFYETGYQIQIECTYDDFMCAYFHNIDHIIMILLDIIVPVFSGIKIAKMIRQKDKTIPIIALTAVNTQQCRQEVKDAGINYFIPKPYVENELTEILADQLSEYLISPYFESKQLEQKD